MKDKCRAEINGVIKTIQLLCLTSTISIKRETCVEKMPVSFGRCWLIAPKNHRGTSPDAITALLVDSIASSWVVVERPWIRTRS